VNFGLPHFGGWQWGCVHRGGKDGRGDGMGSFRCGEI